MQLSAFNFRPTAVRPHIARAFLALSLAVLSSAAAQAEIVVQSASKVQGLNANVKVPDDYVFDLPKDGSVSLLQTPSGETFNMRGPFQGTLQKFVADCKSWMWFRHEYCKSGQNGELPVGGTRGVQQPAPSQ